MRWLALVGLIACGGGSGPYAGAWHVTVGSLGGTMTLTGDGAILSGRYQMNDWQHGSVWANTTTCELDLIGDDTGAVAKFQGGQCSIDAWTGAQVFPPERSGDMRAVRAADGGTP